MRKNGNRFINEYVYGNKSAALQMLQNEAKLDELDYVEEPNDAFFASPSWDNYVDSIISDAINLTPQGYDDLCA